METEIQKNQALNSSDTDKLFEACEAWLGKDSQENSKFSSMGGGRQTFIPNCEYKLDPNSIIPKQVGNEEGKGRYIEVTFVSDKGKATTSLAFYRKTVLTGPNDADVAETHFPFTGSMKDFLTWLLDGNSFTCTNATKVKRTHQYVAGGHGRRNTVDRPSQTWVYDFE